MAVTDSYISDLPEELDEKLTTSSTSQKANVLSSRISSVLSSSYADSDIRDALQILDSNKIQNTLETRRAVRLDVQKEVIERNGDIVKDFGEVAEVCPRSSCTRRRD